MNKLLSVLLVVITTCVLVIAVKSVASKQSPITVLGATPTEQITNWTGGGSFSGDVSVGGDFTASGLVTGVPKALSLTMSSSATTTACTSLNSSGVSRVVLAATVVDRGTAASTGSVAWNAGTSTYSGANGSSAVAYTKVINTVLTRVSGLDVLTTTSTVLGTSGAYSTWPDGSYFNFISGTTTNAGTCRIVYF